MFHGGEGIEPGNAVLVVSVVDKTTSEDGREEGD
jgi:hypothetical protein